MKKILTILLTTILFLAVFVGSTYAIEKTSPKSKVSVIVGFSNTSEQVTSAADLFYPDTSEILNYTSKYSAYNSYIYYSGLSQQEKQIYRLMEYALDHGYPNILIDNRLLDGNQYSASEILRFLSLDSAMVEQNLVETLFDLPVSVTTGSFFKTKHTISTKRLYIPNFSAEKLRKKEAALEKASQIISQIPASLSKTEKAIWIYDYLGENVTWVTRDETNKDFLYDALCVGKSNCDGFANAFSLLCHLTGIDSFEKIYLSGTTEPGHTWNAVQLDGCWYNVDSSGAWNDIKQESSGLKVIRFYFGYSDPLQSSIPLYADFVPKCEADFNPVSNVFQRFNPDEVKEALLDLFQQTQRTYAVFQFSEVSRDDLQAFVATLGNRIHPYHRNVYNNSTLVYFYKSEGTRSR